MEIQKFNICDAEGTPEVTVESNMTPKALQEAWEDYYWSLEYKDHDDFIKRYTIPPMLIRKLNELEEDAQKILP